MSTLRHQAVMAAFFNHRALLQHQNAIRSFHGTQSTLAVASSRMKIAGRCASTRASATSCRWPSES